jgi:hypothetical protein
MVSDRSICGSEGALTNDNSVAHAATEAYRYSDTQSYNSVFTNKATPDCKKSDSQLNNELNSAGSIFGSSDTTSSAIGDLQRGIKSDSRTRHDLVNAIEDASFGNIGSAMTNLRKASTDLNDGGSKIDSGLNKLGDGGQSGGSQIIQRGMVNEADCTQNIQKAEQLLRDGDTEGAINAMQKGIREVAHEQHQIRNGIASLNGSSNAIDWQNFGPVQQNFGTEQQSFGPTQQIINPEQQNLGPVQQNLGPVQQNFGPLQQSYGYGQGDTMNSDISYPTSSSNGNTNTSFYSGYNQGDSYFNSQQQVTRSDNGGWNSTQPFTPDNSGSYQPYLPGSSYNGDTTPLQPSDSQSGLSLSMNLPGQFDLAKQLGLPSPQDIVANLPNPFDLMKGIPNPTDMLGGGSNNAGGGDAWPNPAKGLGSFMKDPAKPIENLLTPPKSAKDLVHKLLDPIGLFG